MRRAFTLLETVMAASIGLLVVLTSVGVLSAINRADAGLGKRAHEIAQLETIHNVLSRALTTISTSDTKPPPELQSMGQMSRTPSSAANASKAPVSGATRNEDNPDEVNQGTSDPAPEQEPAVPEDPDRGGSKVKTTEAPRLLLAADSRDGATPMFLRLTAGSGARQVMPQRLEVVLSQPPVPYPKDAGLFMGGEDGAFGANAVTASTKAPTKSPTKEPTPSSQLGTTGGKAASESGKASGSNSASDAEAEAAAAQAPSMPSLRSFRGAFEFRPEPRRAGASEDEPDAYELWWRPLPPIPGDVVMPAGAQINLPPPTKIADRISYARWQAYQQLTPFDSYRTVWAAELPAYITLEIQTVSGIYSKWMFEVDWVVQPEIERPTSTQSGGGRAVELQLLRPTVVNGQQQSGASGPAVVPGRGSAIPEAVLRGGQPVRGQGGKR